jgi:hypothetical protein
MNYIHNMNIVQYAIIVNSFLNIFGINHGAAWRASEKEFRVTYRKKKKTKKG